MHCKFKATHFYFIENNDNLNHLGDASSAVSTIATGKARGQENLNDLDFGGIVAFFLQQC